MPRKKSVPPSKEKPAKITAVKKKRAVKIKVAKKKPPVIPEIDEETQRMEEMTMAVIKKHFENLGHLAQQAEDPFNKFLTEETKKDYAALALILSEYLDSFIILGYRPDGEMLSMQKFHNTRDRMALEKTLQGLAMGQMGFRQQ